MYAIVNGLKLFYHKEGSGRPVILLHGNGEDHTIFDVAIRDLARSYTVYALDSRAHGKSDPVPSLTYREMAEDVAAFIRQQGLEKPALVGFSDGGVVALLVALRWPDLPGRAFRTAAWWRCWWRCAGPTCPAGWWWPGPT